jgi:threonine synthase
MYNCPHTGVALAALEKLAAKKTIAPDERVVVISTAHGLKFTEFKRSYHQGELDGTSAKHANRPIELPPDVDRVRAAIDARLSR